MAGCALVLASITVRASCLPSDLDGAWRIYAVGGPAHWTKCTVDVVGGTGSITANRVCEDGLGNSYLTTGGQLAINSVCRASGFVDTQAGRITIIHAFLEANRKEVWTGVAIAESDGSNLMFSGVRGLSAHLTNTGKPNSKLATLLAGVNEARAPGQDCGTDGYFTTVAPVTWNTLLAQAAQRHSNDMATVTVQVPPLLNSWLGA